jgi:sugar O-acyltransferase (sialic acid O-acetyltransferase NeuD family)
MKKLVIIGAGGCAREVRWLVEDINAQKAEFEFLGYVVSDLSKLGKYDSRSEILGDYNWFNDRSEEIYVSIGVGTPGARLKISEDLAGLSSRLLFPSLIHPSVHFDKASCKVREGVVICVGTIATVNVEFDSFCLLGVRCTIGHESTIGCGSVLNPSVTISGGVTIGSGVLVGTGAQVLQYLSVSNDSVVGAGAVVTKDVASGMTVVGVPAKPLMQRTGA